ncbi:hypothetical protein [Terrabacter sp. BE26]|uniref:hypothetical protein n=1 Tax=Terrabacter sp. BE26 TaxID=2898152 RepID=UPI0035BE4AD8
MAAVLVGGCGGASSPGSSGFPGSSEAQTGAQTGAQTDPIPATSPPPQSGDGGDSGSEASRGPQFPLTLRRTGGSAGYDDVVVLGADGRVLVETRSVHGRVCLLDHALQRRLLSLLATLRPEASALPSTVLPSDGSTTVGADVAESDPITISVTDDRARAIDLSDPSLGEISGLVGTLVSDVTLTVPAVTRCMTPASPSASSSLPTP